MNPNTFVITVTGARDGVGKSVFATNIALAFQRETRRRVLLVDLDPVGCGDLALLISQKKAKAMSEVANLVDRMTAQVLKGVITQHATGIGFFPLYNHVRELETVSGAAVDRVLELCSELYDFIIIDAGAVANEITVKAMEKSTALFVLTTPELLVLNQSRKYVDYLQGLHFPREMIKLILNKFEQKGALNLEVVNAKLGRKILTVVIKDDLLTTQSVNQGKPFVLAAARTPLAKNYADLARSLMERGILPSLRQLEKPHDVQLLEAGAAANRGPAVFKATQSATGGRFQRGKRGAKREEDARTALKKRIHKRLIEVLDLKRLDAELKDVENKEEVLRERTEQAIIAILDQENPDMRDRAERKQITKEVLDEALGLGCLEDLLADDDVTEVMCNTAYQVFVEKGGKLFLTDKQFTDEQALRAVIERIVAPLGRRIDEKSPMVDARLKDGSRVNAIIPPLAIDGSALTIRKFAKDPYTYKDLIKFGSMTDEIADFLRSCVEARLNILISGGTGSGKTTLLNVMSSFIPPEDRIVTVEDSAELQLPQEHVVRLETRPPNIEGEGEVTIRDLVKNSLRMRPDRIVVGECRSGEALDMLQAMNTGHDGSLTTIHANSPRDALSRLETLVMFTGLELPSRAIREQISSAVHMIIQQSRMSDGTRKITQITEVTGMESTVITTQDIFVYKQTGVDERHKVIGKFMATGFIPRFVEELQQKGIRLPKGIFKGVG